MTCKDIEDALEIVRNAKTSIVYGPRQPWEFLGRVRDYLEGRLAEAYEPIWQELREGH